MNNYIVDTVQQIGSTIRGQYERMMSSMTILLSKQTKISLTWHVQCKQIYTVNRFNNKPSSKRRPMTHANFNTCWERGGNLSSLAVANADNWNEQKKQKK